jgi:TolA-binding protein
MSSFAQAQQLVPPAKTQPPVAPIIKPPAPLQPPPAAQAPTATPEESAKAAFKKGVKSYQQKQFDQAVTSFSQVPELGSGFMSLYKHWFLGNSYLELAKYKEAESEFAKVIQGQQATTEMKYQAQFNLGEAALRQKKYADAIARLQPLERKWRHSYRYPEVLYRLMTADLRTNKIANACKRAKKLYA